MFNKEVPFYANIDGTHCFQAVLKMILKHFWPSKDFTKQELERISAKVEGLWTSPSAAMIWLHDNGFEVINVELFDYAEFANRGGDYLIEHFGKDAGREQIEHCDLTQETNLAGQIANSGLWQKRLPDILELKQRLNERYLVICNVNSCMLNNKEGYCGHFVLLIGYNEHGFIMHDPGGLSGAWQNREVAYADFERAWAYPNAEVVNYVAVKLAR